MMRRVCVGLALIALACSCAVSQEPGRERPPAPSLGAYSIAGQVVDSITGKPLEAMVAIAPTTQPDHRTPMKTGPDGKFAFSGLRAQKFSLLANRRGYPVQGFEQHENYWSAIAVGDGLDSTHLVFRLRSGAAIRGTVVDEANEPVIGALVRLFATQFVTGHRATRSVEQTQTDDLGEYVFSKLSEGSYYVAVSAQPWYTRNLSGQLMKSVGGVGIAGSAPETPGEDGKRSKLDVAYPLTFYDAVRDSAQASAIDLSFGDRFEANFQLVAEPAVHVTVGAPAPPVKEISPAEGAALGAGVALEGGFNPSRMRRLTMIRLANVAFDGMVLEDNRGVGNSAGDTAVSAGVAPGHYVLEISLPNDSRPVFEEIDLTGDIDLRGITIPPTAAVTGSIKFDGDVPKGFVVVSLRNLNSQRGYGTRLGPDGGFKFEEGILPGRYEVAVGASTGDTYIRKCQATGAKLAGRTLIIGEGATVALAIAAGEGLAKIDGVVESEGRGFAGAMIVLVPQDPANSELLFRRDQSDSDGTFILPNVVPGKYTVIAVRNGWRLSWADPKVLATYLPSGTRVEVTPRQAISIKVALK